MLTLKSLAIPLFLLTRLAVTANPLPPGGNVFAVNLNATPGTLPAPPYAATALGSLGGAELRQAVNQVSPNEFHFYYQLVAGSLTTTITQYLLTGFTGYTVDVTHQNAGPGPGVPFINPTGAATPSSVVRFPSGEILVSHVTGVGGSGKPASSTILILKVTGAQGYVTLVPPASGLLNVANLSQQLAPVPEPAFFGAVVLGLAGLSAARLRRK